MTENYDYMVSWVTTGEVRQSTTGLTQIQANQIATELVRQLREHEGWKLEARYRNLHKLSKNGQLLFVSVVNAVEMECYNVNEPPQHWLERGITRYPQAVQS